MGDLVRNLVIVIFLNALLEMLLPGEGFRPYIRLVTGLIIVLMVVSTIAVLLGQAPRLEPVLSGQEALPPYGRGAREPPGEVEALYRRQVLQRCRESLEQLLEEKVAGGGRWELDKAVIDLDEDSESAAFGAPKRIELWVRGAAEKEKEVAPVTISPIKPGEREEEGAEGGGTGEARLPALERSLAELLDLDEAQVIVHRSGAED